jgi:outer membrane receptor protein involved in Fe transport
MLVATFALSGARAAAEALPSAVLDDSAPAGALSGDEAGEIVVTARSEHRIGHDLSASVGAISGDDIRTRPLLRTSELAEAVPGLIAVQHSGGGKAAQYYIRGYNLDHGTDFSISVDGIPMNLPTHAHGQGYLDLNGLIPETIDRIDYRKGPYSPADGDFSLIAAASMRTIDHVDRPFVTLEGGSYGYRRFAAVASTGLGRGDLLLAGDFSANNGPWQLPERLRHYSGFAKYTVETNWGTLRASLSAYDATWQPTEQIPVRAIGTVVSDRFGTLDPFLRGTTQRQMATLGVEGEHGFAVLYAQHYRFDLLSNFTFFLNDPVRGDELEQAEDRRTYGLRLQRRVPLGARWQLTLGSDTRTDRIDDLALYQTEAGQRIATTSLANIRETSLAGYAELRWRPLDTLTLSGGGRIDHYRFRIEGRDGVTPDNRTDATIATPKLSIAWNGIPHVELYGNYGQGFHSNDARGVLAPSDATPALVRGTAYELGARIERGPVIFTLTHWWSRSAGELVYSGDDGTVEPSGPSRRRGWEATLFVRPMSWLAIDAIYATNHARFVDAPGQNRIPNALEAAGSLGLTATNRNGWEGAVRLRHVGPRPLIEDNSVRGPATTVVNLRLAKHFKGLELAADLLNLFDSRRADADYFYASRLQGEPLEGVEGIHSRPVEPRQFRLSAKILL